MFRGLRVLMVVLPGVFVSRTCDRPQWTYKPLTIVVDPSSTTFKILKSRTETILGISRQDDEWFRQQTLTITMYNENNLSTAAGEETSDRVRDDLFTS